jgi:hypothetical protein
MNVNQPYLDAIFAHFQTCGYQVEGLKDIFLWSSVSHHKAGNPCAIRIYQNTKGAVKLDLPRQKTRSRTVCRVLSIASAD